MHNDKVSAEDILRKAAVLKREKSQDYQGSEWTEEDYFPFGHLSYLHMIHTKYLRIRSVVQQESTNFESLEDSLVDMINYCAIYAAWLENTKRQSKENSMDDIDWAYVSRRLSELTNENNSNVYDITLEQFHDVIEEAVVLKQTDKD